MKGIRRFQRTMITVLIGLNILVFSSSFYGDFQTALLHSFVGMAGAGIILLLIGYLRRSKYGKKSFIGIHHSREN